MVTLTDEMRADGWIEHDGGPCPVAGYVEGNVPVLLQCGLIAMAMPFASAWIWKVVSDGAAVMGYGSIHQMTEASIIAYKPEPPMTDRLHLAERIEAAEGPSRELFDLAFALCYPEPAPDCEPAWRAENPKQPIYHAWKTREVEFRHFVEAEAWLSAAEMLVPDGCDWLRVPDVRESIAIEVFDDWDMYGESIHPLPALALCAAALRAGAAHD